MSVWGEFAFEALRSRRSEPESLPEPVPVETLPTPALVLDRAAFESNLQRMTDYVSACGKGVRPHSKTHKCPHIARVQLERGAVGVCAAKLSEAAVMILNGVSRVLITSPIVDPNRVELLNRLCETSDGVAVVVDSEAGANLLVELISHPLQVIVDLDVAMGRTGVRENDRVLALLDRIGKNPHLTFRGFQHYAGHLMHVAPFDDRRTASLDLWQTVLERLDELAQHGVTYEVLTGCGTGTYNIDSEIDAITDLQVGSYIFMDEEYRRIGGHDAERFEDFDVSLSLAVTAISQPRDGMITVDGGYKAMASDTVPAAVDELAATKFRFAGDEHGVLISETGLQSVQLGSVVRLVTPHCDPTVNLHDYYWVLEPDGLIHSRWPITGRGLTW